MIFLFIILYLIYLNSDKVKYKRSNYSLASGNDFSKTKGNRGTYGEFLIFKELEEISGYIMLMTNLYIPKQDGTTTELDLIMISEKGIFVFESKNYSGWIFGDERHKYWTQTLGSKQKYKFYNPIWQNNTHVNALKSVVNCDFEIPYKSYIIFSNRCTLKSINVMSDNVVVMNRSALKDSIHLDFSKLKTILSPEKIDLIHKELLKYCFVSEERKKEHINQYQNKNINNVI